MTVELEEEVTTLRDELSTLAGVVARLAREADTIYTLADKAEDDASDAEDSAGEARRAASSLTEELGDLDILGLIGRLDELAKSAAEAAEGAVDEAAIQARIDAAVAALATPDREPLIRRGIAINVRYGFITGEDEDHGPSLRADVNCDGVWTLTRSTGRKLGRFLRTSGIADLAYLENAVVEVIADDDLGWTFHRLVPASEAEAAIKDELARMEQGVEYVPTSFGIVPVGTRVKTGLAGATYVVEAPWEGGFSGRLLRSDGGLSQGRTQFYARNPADWEVIPPVVHTETGHPLYVGDHVEVDYQDEALRGTVVDRASIKRDDGMVGGGTEVDGVSTWYVADLADAVKLVESAE